MRKKTGLTLAHATCLKGEAVLPARRCGSEGLTIVEAMIAVAVLTVGLVGLLSAISSSMVVDTVAQDNNLALDTARQVLEQVRSARFETLVEKADDPPPSPLVEPTVDWYWRPYVVGEPVPAGIDSVDIDRWGYFSVPGLNPLNPTGYPGERVGNVTVTRADFGGTPSLDVVEIAVTVQWRSARGNALYVMRCQVSDWGG